MFKIVFEFLVQFTNPVLLQDIWRCHRGPWRECQQPDYWSQQPEDDRPHLSFRPPGPGAPLRARGDGGDFPAGHPGHRRATVFH